jgi:hypothetical protein
MPKKMSSTASKKGMSKSELEQALIDNFTSLQKVLTNLVIKFDDLSTNMSKLLQLFEISAKSFVEKHPSGEIEKERKEDKEFINKLDSLLDQNKTIAKGILLMEDRIRRRSQPEAEPETVERNLRSRPLPRI